jgi:hypothetical protein
MKTADLINLLAKDQMAAQLSGIWFRRAMCAATASAAFLLLCFIGVREDIAQATGTWKFFVKFLVEFSISACAVMALRADVHPGTSSRRWIWAAPALIGTTALVLNCSETPISSWRTQWLGHTAGSCVGLMLAMGLLPLLAILLAMKRGAPRSPGRAGAVSGLLASGISGFFYAFHCPENSYLFVASWYGLATLLLVAIGWAIGRRMLRW